MGEVFRSFLVGMQMAAIEMRAHKMRSFLSLVGVTLGVASLVGMLTLIGGIDVYLNKKMAKWMGSVWVWKRAQPQESQKLIWSRSPGMRFTDGSYLEGDTNAVKHVVRQIDRRGQVTVAGVTERAMVRGLEPEALEPDLESIVLERGRWLSTDDYVQGRRNCVVSWEIDERVTNAKRESGGRGAGFDIVGSDLVFQGVRFTVVGLYRPKDPDFKPWHLRRRVLMPLQTMRRYVTGSDPDPGSMEVSVTNVKAMQQLLRSIGRSLQGRHRGVEDFEMRSADWLEQMSSMLNNVSLLMSIVSAISLLVGGLSIMNVMLSSISERIREIGIRKALGAKNLQIFVQFIAETTTLSFSGGVIGAVVGLLPLAFSDALVKATDGVIEPTILPWHVVYVFCILAGVGIVFGLYPALKASSMNPTEALRYE